MDQSFHIEKGLKLARKILQDCAELGLPTATEMLDTIIPQYIADLVCWVPLVREQLSLNHIEKCHQVYQCQ